MTARQFRHARQLTPAAHWWRGFAANLATHGCAVTLGAAAVLLLSGQGTATASIDASTDTQLVGATAVHTPDPLDRPALGGALLLMCLFAAPLYGHLLIDTDRRQAFPQHPPRPHDGRDRFEDWPGSGRDL